MKKTALILIIGCFLALTVNAQVDRSQRPLPGPAPVIQLGEFETFTMPNGMKVIVVENRQVPVVSFQLTLDIDPVMEGDAKGYVEMAGSMLREGTLNRSKSEIDESIDFIGASLSTFSTGAFASSLTRHTETLLELMSDVVLNPSFPEAELQRLITQSISGLSTVKTNASAIMSNISMAVVYGPEHPYGEITTQGSLGNITVDMLKDYYNTNFKPNVAYMVIVGDINKQEASRLMDKYFASWQPGEVPQRTYPTPQAPEGLRVAFGERLGAIQSVAAVTHPVILTPGHPDAIKVSVMNSILGGGAFSGRLMQNLREDKGYTYGAYSRLGTDRLVSRFSASAEVRNEVTDTTVVEILREMRRMITEPVEEASLELTKNFMSGSFARSLESPRTIANFALNIERYNLPEDYYATYLEKLDAVTIEDVQQMAARYLKPENSWIVVAGNKDVIENLIPLASDGQVAVFDAFGRPLQEDDLKPVPAGMNADVVLNNYFEATGGKQNHMKINDITTRMSASMMGMTINFNQYQKEPHYLLVETLMGGNVMSKQIFDGTKAVITSPMGRQEFTEGPEFELFKQRANLKADMEYKQLGISKKLLGIENINGNDAYKIEVISADGSKSYDYYDANTNLKIMSQSPEGTATYGNYKVVTLEIPGQRPGFFARLFGKKDTTQEVELLFPFAISQQMGPQSIDMQVTEMTLNSGIPDSKFSVE
jgi:zinc protease